MMEKLTNFFHTAKRIVVRNFVYKLLALLVAAFVWILIQGREIIEIDRQVHVSIIVPEGYGVEGKNILTKDATIRGSRARLAKFSRAPLEAAVVIRKQKAANFRVRLDRQHIHKWNNNLKLTVHEPYISIKVDKIIKKELPVEIFLQGVPSNDYIIEKKSVTPEKIEVFGLQRKLTKLQKVATLPVEIDGLERNKSFVVGLLNDDPDVTYGVEDVEVILQVGGKKINQEFSGIPIKVINLANLQLDSISPATVAITVQGGKEILNFIETKSFEASVDMEGIKAGKHERKVQIKIPEGTVLIETRPEHALVEVQEKDKTKTE